MNRNSPNHCGAQSRFEIFSLLTPRQAQVLQRFIVTPDDAQVARAMNLNVQTVRNHVARILERLHVQSRAELMQLVERAECDISPVF